MTDAARAPGNLDPAVQAGCDRTQRGPGGAQIEFEEGELMRTEYSYKYTLEEFADLASAAGFVVEDVWTDDERLFSLQYLTTV